MPNDNRMGWNSNLEALASGGQQYTIEYELGSECQLSGVLDCANAQMICAPMSTEKSRGGLWLYNLILHYPSGPHDFNRKADESGYDFKDGVVGELLALMSVFFRCRFYLISSRLLPENPQSGHDDQEGVSVPPREMQTGVHPPLF